MQYGALRFTGSFLKLCGVIVLAAACWMFLQGFTELLAYFKQQNMFGVFGSVRLYMSAVALFSGVLLLAFGQGIDVFIDIAVNTESTAKLTAEMLTLAKNNPDAGPKIDMRGLKSNLGGSEKNDIYRGFRFTVLENGNVEGDTAQGRYAFDSKNEFTNYIDREIEGRTPR